MSFANRLIHQVVHVSVPVDDRIASRDDYGQADPLPEVRTVMPALVQPLTGREAPDSREAGASISDHVIFLAPMVVHPSDYFEYPILPATPTRGEFRFDIENAKNFEFGRSPHLEVMARRIVSSLPTGSLTEPEGS